MAWTTNQSYTGTPFKSGSSTYSVKTQANVSNGTVTSSSFTLQDSNGKAVATSTDGKSWKAAPGTTLSEDTQKSLASGGDLNKQASQAISQDAKKNGASENQISQISSNNKQNNPENEDEESAVTKAQQDEYESEQKTFKEGTRKGSYGNLYYPQDLSLEYQDCIKITILEYRPSLASKSSGGQSSGSSGIDRRVEVKNGVPSIKGSTPLGTITLPIPSGISDSNSVDWQADTLNELQEAGANIALATIEKGFSAGAEAASKEGEKLGKDKESLEKGLTGLFTQWAVKSSRIQQRANGSIFNNNLELLFNGPTLRSAFTFNFKMSPRNAQEAIQVRKIIRAFKQSMSVKRSATSLLLKTPNTYAISYLTSNQEHPYLNKFKECALISCNVDYTPEGTYMTYMSSNIDERSMVSYNLSLTFQELEPIFDDDYGALDTNTDKFIGY